MGKEPEGITTRRLSDFIGTGETSPEVEIFPPSPSPGTPDPSRLGASPSPSPFSAPDSESTVRLLRDFRSKGEKSSGKSPSEPMLDSEGITYQVKRSNSIKPERSLVGLDPDPSDSIGEFFASVFAKEIAPLIYGAEAAESRELSPEVKLVIDETGHEVRLASKYLNMVPKVEGETPERELKRTRFQGVTLDQVLEGKIEASSGKKEKLGHPILEARTSSLRSDEKKTLSMGSSFECSAFKDRDGSTPTITLDKKQLYQALKISLLLGDHDVNPGNLFVVYDKDTKSTNICRIDYGHAFNDLIKNWSFGRGHTPSLEKGRYSVLDALNRQNINGGPSKFKRDYRGVIPDIEFAEVLRAGSEGLEQKLDIAQGKCLTAIESLIETGDDKIVSSTKKALQTLCSRIGVEKPPEEIAAGIAVIESREFIKNNAEEMKSVANLIEIQSLVQKVGEGKTLPKEAAKRIVELYKEDKLYLQGKNFVSTASSPSRVEWVTMDGDKSPKICSLEQYIESRKSRANQAALTDLIRETSAQFTAKSVTPSPARSLKVALTPKPESRVRSQTSVQSVEPETPKPMRTPSPKPRARAGTEIPGRY